VLRAEGRETRGQGNANATITVTLDADGDATKVSVVTDLTITGKVAQFGRGVLADVSSKLLGQFVQALEADVLKGAAVAGTGTTEAAPVDVPRRIDSPSTEPVDLLAAAGSSVIKRFGLPVVVLVAVLPGVLWLRLLRQKPPPTPETPHAL